MAIPVAEREEKTLGNQTEPRSSGKRAACGPNFFDKACVRGYLTVYEALMMVNNWLMMVNDG